MGNLVLQYYYQVVTVLVYLPAQWQAGSINLLLLANAFVALWLAKQLLYKPFITSAATCLI